MSAATSLPPSLNDIVFHVLDPLEAVERDIFLTRAEAWYPDLLDGLTTLYGDAAEEEALNLLALAARAYAERDYELRRLDLARTLDPAWAQHPGRGGPRGRGRCRRRRRRVLTRPCARLGGRLGDFDSRAAHRLIGDNYETE